MALNVNTIEPDTDTSAAKWLARRDHGLTAAEQTALAEWLRSPGNAEAFRQAEAFWNTLPQLNRLSPGELYSLTEPRRHRLAPVIWLSAGMAAAAAVAMFFTLREPLSVPSPAVIVRNHQAPVDAESRFLLPDGSIAVLHRGSRISFGQFSDSRQVRLLEGEAHFTVAKKSPLPFLVRAGQVTVRDIGTAFNVRLDSDRVAVFVTDGKVEVRNDSSPDRNAAEATLEPVLLSKGQQAVVDTATAVVQIDVPTAPQAEQSLAWKSRRLTFDRTPLATAVIELNRYNVRQLSIADPEINSMLIAGGVQSDNLDAFVRLLDSGFGITAEMHGDEIVLRKTR